MKSTPFELRAFYLPGAHPNTPEEDRKSYPGQRLVGGFVFTNGAMSLRLSQLKSERQAKYLFAFHQIISEVLERVDVPARARVFSPKSEAEGVLGLVADDADGGPEGQPAKGGGTVGPSAVQPTVLEADRTSHRDRRSHAGSSVAASGGVDPAKRAALIADDAGGLT